MIIIVVLLARSEFELGGEKRRVYVVRLRATTNQKSLTLEKLRIERWTMLQVCHALSASLPKPHSLFHPRTFRLDVVKARSGSKL